MDIILLVIACFYISKKAKAKGLDATSWVLRLVGVYIVFELTGVMISFAITGGNFVMASVFGFFCAVGGFLVIKYNLERKPAQH